MTSLPEPIPEAEYSFGTTCGDDPRFTQIGFCSWLWVSGPLLVHVCDTIYRFTRRLARVKLVAVSDHPYDVMELQSERSRFTAKPGQCPVSERLGFSVQIRACGDWSGDLKAENLLLKPSDILENEGKH